MRASTYRPDIDGLRAVAVLLVVGYHAFPKLVPGGYIGVDVFFVISGYLITGIILEPLQTGTFSFREFYRRRIRRIFPALIAVLAATMVLGLLVLAPAELKALAKHTLAAAAFVSNIAYWREAGYFDAAAETKPLLHLWSLGIEEQFYIVWPLTLLVVTRLKLPVKACVAVLALASFVMCVSVTSDDSVAAFYAPYTRAWELLAGALLVGLELRWRPASLAGVAMILAAAALLTTTSTFPGWWALLPVAGTVGVIAAGADSPVNRFLSHPAAVAIGLISYPLYLWHWPLLSLAYTHWAGELSIAVRLGAVALAFVLAAGTYWVIEGNLRRTRTWRPAFGLIAAMATVSLAGVFVYRSDGFAGSVSGELQALSVYDGYDVKFKEPARHDVCWLPYDDPTPAYRPECSPSAPGGVVIWGDSYAARLYPGIRATFGDNVGQYNRSSCLPLPQSSPCGVANAWVLDEIKRVRPRTVVIYAAWATFSPESWDADGELGRPLRQSIAAFDGVPQVILLGPAPRWKLKLPALVYQEGHIPDRLSTGLDTSVFEVDARLRKLATAPNVRYVSVLDLMCTSQGCLTHPPGQPTKLMSWDTGHFTLEGAQFVAESLLKPLY